MADSAMVNSEAASWRDQWRWASWVLMAIIAIAALIVGVADNDDAQTQGERVAAISATILCPQCTGQTVAQSNVAIARTIRADIATRVSAGESDDQIRQAYIENYGEWIITAFAFARWRRALRATGAEGGGAEGDQAASDADRVLVDDARRQRGRPV